MNSTKFKLLLLLNFAIFATASQVKTQTCPKVEENNQFQHFGWLRNLLQPVLGSLLVDSAISPGHYLETLERLKKTEEKDFPVKVVSEEITTKSPDPEQELDDYGDIFKESKESKESRDYAAYSDSKDSESISSSSEANLHQNSLPSSEFNTDKGEANEESDDSHEDWWYNYSGDGIWKTVEDKVEISNGNLHPKKEFGKNDEKFYEVRLKPVKANDSATKRTAEHNAYVQMKSNLKPVHRNLNSKSADKDLSAPEKLWLSEWTERQLKQQKNKETESSNSLKVPPKGFSYVPDFFYDWGSVGIGKPGTNDNEDNEIKRRQYLEQLFKNDNVFKKLILRKKSLVNRKSLPKKDDQN